MEEIVTARDRTALFRQGITIVDAGRSDGRLTFEATGGDDDRVRDVIRAHFGADGEPCEVPSHVHLDRPLAGRTVYDGCGGREIRFKNVCDGIEARVAAESRTTAGG